MFGRGQKMNIDVKTLEDAQERIGHDVDELEGWRERLMDFLSGVRQNRHKLHELEDDIVSGGNSKVIGGVSTTDGRSSKLIDGVSTLVLMAEETLVEVNKRLDDGEKLMSQEKRERLARHNDGYEA
jgi:predicted  nucleic acid-binding Zn-ribbon protein